MVRKATRKYLKEQGTKVTKKDPKNMSASEKAQYKKLVKRMGVKTAAEILAGMGGVGAVRIGAKVYLPLDLPAGLGGRALRTSPFQSTLKSKAKKYININKKTKIKK